MRLIDADALKRELEFWVLSGFYRHILLEHIDNAPTVERPKGKWIKEDKPWGGFGDSVLVNTCSECGESFVYHGNNPKYCPECGADMRGGQENDPN